MKRWLLMLSGALIASASTFIANLPRSTNATAAGQSTAEATNEATATASTTIYRNYGAAPELLNEIWLNTDSPLRLADLRGSVVLLEHWTFDCINCIRTIPYVQGWYETYADQGLVVIGNHFPEFGYEREIDNVRTAIERLGITYPVAQDNDGITWRAYNQRYWPTMYLIDKAGDIRYITIGEGRYNITEQAIRDLLAEPYTPPESTAESTSQP